jgi:hypothetical protein
MTQRVLSVLLLAGTFMTMSSCGSERLLSARFYDQAVGNPPAINQEVGQVRAGDFGTVNVVPGPKPGSGNWVQLTSYQDQKGAPARLRGSFSAFRGDGRYLVTMRLFIKSQMGAFISFGAGQFDAPSFFTLDLPQSGSLYAPGSRTIIGGFPHDQFFSVAVNLNIGPTSTVKVTLLGLAHGSFDYTLEPQANDLARQFVYVTLETDFPEVGTLFANDLSVIYNTP